MDPCICEGSCVAKRAEGGEPPLVPDDSGIDLLWSRELCRWAVGEVGPGVLDARMGEGKCPERPTRFDELAQCSGGAVCYNADRIERWVADIACRVAGFIAARHWRGRSVSSDLRPIVKHLVSHSVALAAYSFLAAYVRARYAGLDGGEAMAYALYHAYTGLVMRLHREEGGAAYHRLITGIDAVAGYIATGDYATKTKSSSH